MSDLRVAVVGAGPAGAYAAGHLLRHGAEVALLDRLPTPWGLVRAGVAPDHQQTKSVARTFEWTARSPRCSVHLNVAVGRDVTHDELLARHHAVVYATGASGGRTLGIDGEDGPGCHSAADFVAWYNGHPDHAGATFDLAHPRVAIVGNGNVALDVARVLSLGDAALARTDIADHALAALGAGAVREVVIVGRRGPEHAAFTSPELLALTQLDGVDVVVDPADLAAAAPPAGFAARLKLRLLSELADAGPSGAPRRIVLRFGRAPVRLLGTTRVEGLDLGDEVVETGLVLRSIGYRGYALDGVPFDAERGTLPNEGGRVAPGVYATGWIRRGPSGVIGTNKHCAAEAVAALLDDHAAGRLTAPEDGPLPDLPGRVGLRGWAAIDAHERAAGRDAGRPRIKLTDPDAMVAIAQGAA